MENTARLSLPLLIPGQAQKELFHNEAIQLLDCVVAGAIEEPARNDPPLSPTSGQSYLIGQAPTAEWSGYADHIAAFTAGGWRYVAPMVGLALIEKSSRTPVTYGLDGWEAGIIRGSSLVIDGQPVVGAQADSIADPVGGATIDAEARSTISEMLSALRQHGLISR